MGTYNNNLITAFQTGTEKDVFTERYIELRANSVVVATGCIERPLLFENNERPGVMQAGCASGWPTRMDCCPARTGCFHRS